MTKRKLVITVDLLLDYINQIKKIIPDWEIIATKDREIWEPHMKDAEIAAGFQFKHQSKDLVLTEKLKWIQSWSAGINQYPLQELEAKGIYLTTANGVHAYPISETIFAFMLGLTRKIPTFIKNQQTKTWNHGNLMLEMHEKTVGILGVGEIGKETAKIAKAFGMEVLGVRYSGRDEDYVDEMYTPDQLNTILPRCDYVVITLPLTDDTYHMFDKEQFKQMKRSAFLINIGRGPIVNEEALIKALEKEEIAGAGLDVFEKEPLSENSPFWEMDNVIITPHNAGSTEHYNKRVVENILIPNLKEYLLGKAPSVNRADFKKGY